jgi:hypothetical protein
MNKETQSTAQEILSKYKPMQEYPNYYHENDIEEAMEEYANQKLSAHQFKQSPSDAKREKEH